MPCYQVRTVNLDLSQARNIKALKTALESLGATVTYQTDTRLEGHAGYKSFSFRRGQGLTIQEGSGITAPMVRAAYGTAVVRQAATRFGWKTAMRGKQLHLSKRGIS